MGNVEQLDLRRKEGSGLKSSRFESLKVGESAEAVCALCGGAGQIWRDERDLLQQTFEHDDPCLLDVLMRHVTEEIRLKIGLGAIQRELLRAKLTNVKELRDTNLLVTGWVDRLLDGEDIALSSYEPTQ